MEADPNVLGAETHADRDEYETDLIETGEQVVADEYAEAAAASKEASDADAGESVEEPAAPAEDPRMAALIARLEAQDRTIGELKEHQFHQAVKNPLDEIPDQPPVDPRSIKTNDEWIAYENWKQQWTFKQATLAARAEARAESAVASARGELSDSNMGAGYGFDAMVGQYTAPAERKNPALTAFFNQTDDPAAARYTYAFMRKIGEKAAGNRVKAFQQLRDFVEGKTSGEAQLTAKIKKAEQTGAARVQQTKGATPKGPRREKTAAEIEAMSDEQYRKYRVERGNPL